MKKTGTPKRENAEIALATDHAAEDATSGVSKTCAATCKATTETQAAARAASSHSWRSAMVWKPI
jgi:hypothetical protein